MKVGVVVTMHYSKKNRPSGIDLMDKFLSTLYENLNYDFNVYIIDNQSNVRYNLPDKNNIWYHYVENQFETGLTGAWNLGIKKAISDDCDIILNVNDDIEFNETVNNFISIIDNHGDRNIGFFGPVTDNCPGWKHQRYDKPIDKLIELKGTDWTTCLSGFFVGFTNNFYERVKHTGGELFDQNHKHNCGDGKWGGQEGEQLIWKKHKGVKLFVVGSCWIKHIKDRGWKRARDKGVQDYK